VTNRHPGDRVGRALFRHRGLVPVIPILFSLVFADPRPPLVVAGLVLMLGGEAIRLWAAAHLGLTARSSSPRAGKLVTRGPYAHTRHPLYWGNFALTLGYTLATGAGFPWFPLLVMVGFVLLYVGHARREEELLAQAFPAPHGEYRARVPALGWKVSGVRVAEVGNTGVPSWRRALRVEALTLNAEVWLLVALWIRIRWVGGGGG
jgi:protein-S-isoprenylcysteine O-methyltransferase Ste14